MSKTALAILLLLSALQVSSQYVYKGQVFSILRETQVSGEILLANRKNPTDRRNRTFLTSTDPAGNFSFSLKDTTAVYIVFSSFRTRETLQRVFYDDSIQRIFVDTSKCGHPSQINNLKAQNNIEMGGIRLLDGFPSYTLYPTAADSAFERKYRLMYEPVGDDHLDDDCVWLYNRTVAGYLDYKYGEEWRAQVRPGVLLPSTKNSSNPIYKTIPDLQQIDSIAWTHLQNGYYKSINRFYTEGFSFNKNGTFNITSSGCLSSSENEAGYWYIRDNASLVLQYPTHTRIFDVLKFDRHLFLVEQGERVKFLRDLDTELKQERFMNRGADLKEADERYTPQFFIGWHLLSKYCGYEL